MGAIELVEKSQLAERPAMKAGDTVKVHVKVREGDKERIQIFEGVARALPARASARPSNAQAPSAAKPAPSGSVTLSRRDRTCHGQRHVKTDPVSAGSSSPCGNTPRLMRRVMGRRGRKRQLVVEDE